MDNYGVDGSNNNNNGCRGDWVLMMFRSSKNGCILRLRHRMLWDLMLHLNFFASKLQVWKSAGRWHLRELLARMGFPFKQCHQPCAVVGPGMRSRLEQLAPTIYDSMKFLLSMVDAVFALLDVPRKEETAPTAARRCCQYNMRMRLLASTDAKSLPYSPTLLGW